MVSFYLRDKSCKKTSIGCSIYYPGQKRIWFPVKNIKISPSDWGVGRMITGRGKLDNGRIQDKLNDLKSKITNFYSDYYDSYFTYPSKKHLFDFY